MNAAFLALAYLRFHWGRSLVLVLALALIIVGSGFLKANISVMVGQLYPRTDIRRDPAYTIF